MANIENIPLEEADEPNLQLIEGGPVATALAAWQKCAGDGAVGATVDTAVTAGLERAANLTAEQVDKNPLAAELIKRWAELYDYRPHPFTEDLPTAEELVAYDDQSLAGFAATHASVLSRYPAINELATAARALELATTDPQTSWLNQTVGGIIYHLIYPDVIGLKRLQKVLNHRLARPAA